MIGNTLSHYRVVERLGSGGMGEVYLAEDVKLERRVALKILPPALATSSERLERFKREARALAKLNHPNIVTVHAIERADEVDFLVMEYVEGKTLSRHAPTAGLGMAEFFSIAVPLADALASAHEAGVIHRDLKPTNIMVTERGRPKILDFGIAKLIDRPAAALDTNLETEALTGADQILGTAPYMAPEQLQGRPIDERSDIFSLGIVLYQLATGRRPFSGDTSAEVVSSILRDDPMAADEIRDELPHHLGRIIRHCLEKDPEKRLQSAKDLRNEMADLERELTAERTANSARPSPAAPAVAPAARRRLSRRPLVAVAALAVIGVLAIWQLAPNRTAAPGISAEARDLLAQGLQREMSGHTRNTLEDAEERYRRALQMEPASGEIKARLAALLTLLHSQYPQRAVSEEAQQLAAEALESDADLPLAHVALGRLLLDGDPAAAEQAARRAIRVAPDDHEGYGLLGQALIRQGLMDEGFKELEAGVSVAGSDFRARLTLAIQLSDEERYDEAAAEYVRILEYDPEHPDALNNLAAIYLRTGRYADAIPRYKRLLELDDEDDYAAHNLGVIYHQLGRFHEAIEAYEKSHRINPSKPSSPHALGEAHERLGDLETARDWFARAVSNYDAALAAGGNRAYLLGPRAFCVAKLGRFDEARQDLAEALELVPDDGYSLFCAAQVAALAGDRGNTYAYIERAVEAGYARQEILSDAAFMEFRDDPAFLGLLEAPAD